MSINVATAKYIIYFKTCFRLLLPYERHLTSLGQAKLPKGVKKILMPAKIKKCVLKEAEETKKPVIKTSESVKDVDEGGNLEFVQKTQTQRKTGILSKPLRTAKLTNDRYRTVPVRIIRI